MALLPTGEAQRAWEKKVWLLFANHIQADIGRSFNEFVPPIIPGRVEYRSQ